MNTDEYPESDSSDEDYVPEDGKSGEVLSEVDSDGDSEEPLTDNEEKSINKKSQKKRMSKSSKCNKRKKRKTLETQKESQTIEQNDENKEENSANQTKAVDDLWADFIKDTGFRPKNSKSNEQNKSSSTTTRAEDKKEKIEKQESIRTEPAKVKITQVLEFAGEEITLEKEVHANSLEAQRLNKQPGRSKKNGGGGGGGISNILSQLGKKQKLSALEKSQLDWNKFKQEENLEEELQTYNKGKDGYLDKQDFLQRADLRRFEIEKEVRNTERAKRFTSTK